MVLKGGPYVFSQFLIIHGSGVRSYKEVEPLFIYLFKIKNFK